MKIVLLPVSPILTVNSEPVPPGRYMEPALFITRKVVQACFLELLTTENVRFSPTGPPASAGPQVQLSMTADTISPDLAFSSTCPIPPVSDRASAPPDAAWAAGA